MLGIFETEAFCHLVDRQTLVVELFLGGSEQVVVDEVLCRAAGLRFHQLSEVACWETAFVGEIAYGGQSLLKGLFLDILAQKEVELLHHRVVDFLAGDELPVSHIPYTSIMVFITKITFNEFLPLRGYKWLIKDNILTKCLHNRKIIRIFALRKVRNDNCVIRLIWTKGREE